MSEQAMARHLAEPKQFWGDEQPPSAPAPAQDTAGLLAVLEAAVWSIVAAGGQDQHEALSVAPAGRSVDHSSLAEFDDL